MYDEGPEEQEGERDMGIIIATIIVTILVIVIGALWFAVHMLEKM